MKRWGVTVVLFITFVLAVVGPSAGVSIAGVVSIAVLTGCAGSAMSKT